VKFKYVILPVVFAAVLGLAAAPAFAETATSTSEKKQEREHKALTTLLRKSGPSIHIGMGGRAQIDAAVVTAVSGSDLTVKLFGQTYKVSTANAEKTEGIPAVDGRVWIKGKVNESTGVIDAVSVRTFTAKEKKEKEEGTATTTDKKMRPEGDFQKQINMLLEKIKQLQAR